MNELDLAGIVDGKIAGALGYMGGRLSQERLKAARYYAGEKFGELAANEGRSSVVSRDVAEAIDGMMPSLIKIFSAGDEVVRFEPRYKEPRQGETAMQAVLRAEAEARQATDYINWIWNSQNDGFGTFFAWFKDALLARLGVVKIWWDEYEHYERQRYEGLTDEQFQALQSDPSLELKEHDEYPDPAAAAMAGPAPQPQGGEGGEAVALPPAPKLHDAVFSKTAKRGRVRIAPIPSDEFLIDRRAVSLDEAAFTAHRRKWTVSDLKQEYPTKKTEIDGLPGDDDLDFTQERQQRFGQEDELPYRETVASDPATREVWVTECYLRVDFDGDGIAELRQVTFAGAGTGGAILCNDEVDRHPFAAITPIPMPHKLFGMSIADQTLDLQLIKSVLWRGALDSLYLSLSPMVATKGKVDMDALLNRRPGGVVQMGADGVVEPIPHEPVAQEAYQMIAYADSVRDSRTGVRRFTAGPGADALNNAYTDTATGANIQQDASAERLELIARVFAETGVKSAFRRILELICKHQDQPQVIRLRGTWVPMDPREWDDEMDMTISVGIGTGNKQVHVAAITNLLALDKEIIQLQGGVQGPLLTMENIYNKLAKLVEASGLKSVEAYYTDPSHAPQQPQQPQQRPDPAMAKVQGQLQLEQQRDQMRAEMQRQKDAAHAQLKQMQAVIETNADLKKAWISAMAAIEAARVKAGADAGLGAYEIAVRNAAGAYDPQPAATAGAVQ